MEFVHTPDQGVLWEVLLSTPCPSWHHFEGMSLLTWLALWVSEGDLFLSPTNFLIYSCWWFYDCVCVGFPGFTKLKLSSILISLKNMLRKSWTNFRLWSLSSATSGKSSSNSLHKHIFLKGQVLVQVETTYFQLILYCVYSTNDASQ